MKLHTCTVDVLQLYLAPCTTYEDVYLWQQLRRYAAAFNLILSESASNNQAIARSHLSSRRMSHTWCVLHLLNYSALVYSAILCH